MTSDVLRSVELRGVPLALASRSTDHFATLLRELALIDASDDVTAHRRLIALSGELQEKYARLGAAQRERAEAAVAAGATTLDLNYQVPPDLADDFDRLETLLAEVDDFCRNGELVTLVTPVDLSRYRTWLFDEFRAQLRESAAPRKWTEPAATPEAALQAAEPEASPSMTATIEVDEDLDLEGTARVRDEISQHLENGATDLCVDLRRCEFVDSVGISLLLTTLARLREAGGSLVLFNVSDAVQRTMRHAGIHDLLVRS